MKYISVDKKTIKINVKVKRDLLFLYKIINKGDIISGEDYRVLKYDNSKEKRKIKLKLQVEDIKFSEYKDSIRTSGKVISSNEEDIIGHFHTFEIKIGSEFELVKNNGFKKYELELLKKSEKDKEVIYIISLDNNSIALGYIDDDIKIISESDINIPKDDPNFDSKLYKVYSKYIDILTNYSPRILCIVGPAFYPDNFYNYIKDKIKIDKILAFKVSIGGSSGIYEFSKRYEYLETLKELEILKLNKLTNDILYYMTKELISYGLDETYNYALQNNIEYILVSEDYFDKLKQTENFNKLLSLFDVLNDIDADIYFINESVVYYDLVNKFGIVGKLRYKI
ncbi:protein pelota [Nanobdella aerobiophila]|uniref:Protein pelota n=1 Tax=Nanobdella aerobiophila TaxID=2586965 RepID=A0A915SCS4_9ARCH|nr:hypothetical protein [Nanobdella aerobiophila]BBL45628.1 protein pelota [Nanobdella aerobiophila]